MYYKIRPVLERRTNGKTLAGPAGQRPVVLAGHRALVEWEKNEEETWGTNVKNTTKERTGEFMNGNDGCGSNGKPCIGGPGSLLGSKDDQMFRDLNLRDALILFSVLHLSDPDFLPDDSWHELCFEV